MKRPPLTANQRAALMYVKGVLLERYDKMPAIIEMETTANQILKRYYETLRQWGDDVSDLKDLRMWLKDDGLGNVILVPVLVDGGGDLVTTIEVDWEWDL